jgi:hypothetical protein
MAAVRSFSLGNTSTRRIIGEKVYGWAISESDIYRLVRTAIINHVKHDTETDHKHTDKL